MDIKLIKNYLFFFYFIKRQSQKYFFYDSRIKNLGTVDQNIQTDAQMVKL